jgi:hypothetical protein
MGYFDWLRKDIFYGKIKANYPFAGIGYMRYGQASHKKLTDGIYKYSNI